MKEQKDNVQNIEKNLPHKVSEVICVLCNTRWIATRPVGLLLKNIECGHCYNFGYVIETGEIIDE